MGFLENNLIPNIHGMVFTINTENEIDRVKVNFYLSALIPIDNIIFAWASKGRHERYFDISQMDEAKAFVNPD